MDIYMYVHKHVQSDIFIYIFIYMYIHIHAHVHLLVHLYSEYEHVPELVHFHVHLHVCTWTWICAIGRGGHAQLFFESAIAIPQLEGSISTIAILQLFKEMLLRNRNPAIPHLQFFLKTATWALQFHNFWHIFGCGIGCSDFHIFSQSYQFSPIPAFLRTLVFRKYQKKRLSLLPFGSNFFWLFQKSVFFPKFSKPIF